MTVAIPSKHLPVLNDNCDRLLDAYNGQCPSPGAYTYPHNEVHEHEHLRKRGLSNTCLGGEADSTVDFYIYLCLSYF